MICCRELDKSKNQPIYVHLDINNSNSVILEVTACNDCLTYQTQIHYLQYTDVDKIFNLVHITK